MISRREQRIAGAVFPAGGEEALKADFFRNTATGFFVDVGAMRHRTDRNPGRWNGRAAGRAAARSGRAIAARAARQDLRGRLLDTGKRRQDADALSRRYPVLARCGLLCRRRAAQRQCRSAGHDARPGARRRGSAAAARFRVDRCRGPRRRSACRIRSRPLAAAPAADRGRRARPRSAPPSRRARLSLDQAHRDQQLVRPGGRAVSRRPQGRAQFVRKYYLGLPFRVLRENKRRWLKQ